MSTSIFLANATCPAVLPFASGVSIAFEQVVAFGAGAHIADVPAGTFTLSAEAYASSDASGLPVAQSCVENVSVRAGANTALTVAFSSAR